MNSLPGELVSHVYSFLPTPSVKSFRLCCKALAEIGEDYLFQNFEFRLYPNDHRLYQLEQLALNASIAAKLKCLSFESGIPLEYADFRYWQAQTYKEISSTWSRTLLSEDHDAYVELHAALQARFTPDMPHRYNLYRWHLDQQGSLMAEERVRNMLVRTMNLLRENNSNIEFKIVMNEPQIRLEELEAFDSTQYRHQAPEDPDPRRRVTNRRQHCLNHFVNFLDAAQRSSYELSQLIAVNLPHQLLTVSSARSAQTLEETFRALKKVDIKVSAFPHSDWLSRSGLQENYFGGRHLPARRLRMLLNNPSNLEHLRLEFPKGKESEYSFDLFDRTDLDRFPRLWLPHLKILELCRFRCRWEDLKAFLQDARNLEILKLSYCRLETGSILDLMHFVPGMRLQKLSIDGDWFCDEDCGEWHSHTAKNFTDCIAVTSYEGPYLVHGMRSKVEEFMLRGGECPLPRWTLDGREHAIWEWTGDTSWHYLPGFPRD